MCRWISYCGEPALISHFLYETEYSLIRQSLRSRKTDIRVNGDGFGLGWYNHQPHPGLFRDVLPAWSDENLKNLAEQIRSHLFIAHARAATHTEVSRNNCHPFASGKVLFAHNGVIGGYPLLRRSLESSLNDHWYQRRRGSTDSELMFLLLLQNGARDSFMHAASHTIEQIMRLQQQVGTEEPLRISMVYTNGEQLWVLRFASDDDPPSVFYRALPEGWIIASEPYEVGSSAWYRLGKAQAMRVCRKDRQVLQIIDL